MRILRIIARLNVGGPAIHATSLTRAFNANGDESLLVAGSIDPSEGDMNYLADGVPVQWIPELGRNISLFRDLSTFRKLSRLVRDFRPDIIHTHTAKAGTLGRVAALRRHVPVSVHTFHGHVFSGYFPPRKTKAILFIERLLARHTDAIIALSPSQKKDLVESYRVTAESKVRIIPLGLDLAPFLKIVPTRRTGSGQPFRIGWVGRFVPVKDPLAFVCFAKLVTAQLGATCTFVMVGGGALVSQVKAAVHREGLRDLFEFQGWRASMPEVYARLDLVVLTSLNEGTPVALIESMASGTPVCALNAGGTADVVINGKTGLIAKNISGLAERACQILEDRDLCSRLVREGVEHVSANYQFERLVRDLKRLYGELLARPKS